LPERLLNGIKRGPIATVGAENLLVLRDVQPVPRKASNLTTDRAKAAHPVFHLEAVAAGDAAECAAMLGVEKIQHRL
jgi:hypothetical protein